MKRNLRSFTRISAKLIRINLALSNLRNSSIFQVRNLIKSLRYASFFLHLNNRWWYNCVYRIGSESLGEESYLSFGQKQGWKHLLLGIRLGFEFVVSWSFSWGENEICILDLWYQQWWVHLEWRAFHRVEDDGGEQLEWCAVATTGGQDYHQGWWRLWW